MRVLLVEDEPYMAEAIRDGLRLEAIAADIAGDGDTALELLSVNAYDIAVLDRDIPGPSGDEIAKRIVASASGMPILMLTAADRLDDKTTGFELGADDYLTKPFELQELVLRLRALDRRRAHNRPPVREIAGLRLDPFRREVHRDGRYVALTRKQFAVLEVLVAADGGVVSAEELLGRAWDQNADPFTNAVRITVSALRKRLGEPGIIATVAGAGYRIDTLALASSSRSAPPPSSWWRAPCSSLPSGWSCCETAPPACSSPGSPTSRAPSIRTTSARPRSARRRSSRWRSCWCSASWAGGSWPAACSRPSRASPPPRARRHGDRSPTGSSWKDGTTNSASSPTRSTPCSRSSRPTSPNRSASRPTPLTSCARRWRSPRRCSTWPPRTPSATMGSSSSASISSTPGRSTSPKRCSCSAAPTSGPSYGNRSTCRSSRRRPPRRSSPSRRSGASRSGRPGTGPPPSARPRCCCRWRRTSCTTRSSTTCRTRAPCGSRPALSRSACG